MAKKKKAPTKSAAKKSATADERSTADKSTTGSGQADLLLDLTRSDLLYGSNKIGGAWIGHETLAYSQDVSLYLQIRCVEVDKLESFHKEVEPGSRNKLVFTQFVSQVVRPDVLRVATQLTGNEERDKESTEAQEDKSKASRAILRKIIPRLDDRSWDCSVEVFYEFDSERTYKTDEERPSTRGRANVSLANSAEYLTFHLRLGNDITRANEESDPEKLENLFPAEPKVNPLPNPKYPISNRLQSHILREQIQKEIGGDALSSGVIVMAGATGSGKTQISTQIAMDIVLGAREKCLPEKPGKWPKKRPPHLVTYEDPIENWKFLARLDDGKSKEVDLRDAESAIRYGINLTAREQPHDTRSLRDAFNDAKRQKPRCFYVGEVRRPSDWIDIIAFGASGHLVVVTTHSSSIREIASSILRACQADSPSLRRTVFGTIRGIIHVRMEGIEFTKRKLEHTDDVNLREKIEEASKQRKLAAAFNHGKESTMVVLPTLWTGSSKAISGLVSVGLSSVAPNRSYHMSRQRVVQAMRDVHDEDGLITPKEFQRGDGGSEKEAEFKAFWNAVEQKARQIDLDELRGN